VITPGQVAVPSGSAVPLGTVPAASQAAVCAYGGTIFLGAGTGVTASTGMPVTGYALLPPNGPGASPAVLYAIAGSGTVSAGFVVATPR
jgi:hypothetical protein